MFISKFVDSVAPIAWLVLYNNYEEEARTVFSSLALIAPATVIPRLLSTLATAADILTEPHRFHVCIQAVSAIAGPLVRHFPGGVGCEWFLQSLIVKFCLRSSYRAAAQPAAGHRCE